ncbi:MAG: hypothetical protein NDJ19_00850 [Ramlibacter sp.]|nr:hypothetical protein [Ramlibacter sp.]
MAITINSTYQPTADESNLSQNLALIGAAAGDQNDNDVTVAVINGSSDLPDTFENFLTSAGVLGNATTVPLAVALSGFDGSNSGEDLVTITGAYDDLAFTDGKGAALDGDFSGLYTLDGTQIFLYTQSNNNIVLGRVGTAGGDKFDLKDTANSNGAIAFAAYLDETNTGTGGSAKVWMAQFQPLHHTNPNDGDDAVDMTNQLYVSTTTAIEFEFAGLPSGQNEFLMFKGSSGNVGLIITGKDPDRINDHGKLDGDTVNTSQGGGPTTIGTNNQSIDPPTKTKPGEGMIFTFVTDPNSDYTVPDLTHEEATTEANILYGDLFGTMGASIDIAQQTPPKASTARLSAYTTAEEQGTAYYEGLLDTDDDLVYIDSVTIRDASGAKVAGFDGVKSDTTVGSLKVTFGAVESDDGIGTTVEGRSVEISGFESGYTLEYTTSTPHHRVMIEALDGTFGSSPFDIGGVSLPSSTTQTQEIGSFVNFEDDAPSIVGTATGIVDEEGLAGNTAPEGVNGDVKGADLVASGVLTTVFKAGNDGLLSFGLDDSQLTGIKAYESEADAKALTNALTLTSDGGAVAFDVQTDTLWGFVDGDGNAAEYDGGVKDRGVFKLELSGTDKVDYKFTLLDNLDHLSLDGKTGDDSENDIVLALGSVLKVTDKDKDSVLGDAEHLLVTVDDDSPTADGTGQTGTVDEDGLTGGISGGYGDYVPSDAITITGSVAAIFSPGADGLKSYGLSADTTKLDQNLKSSGGAVVYEVKGDTLTAYVDGDAVKGFDGGTKDRAVFTLSLDNPTKDGSYTFKLLGPLDHPLTDDPSTNPTPVETSFEDDLILELGTLLQITDKDGDKITAAGDKLKITVDDDSPVGFTPDSIKLLNDGEASATKNLNSDTAVGADGLGTLVFVDTNTKDNYLYDAKANLLKSGGENIVLSGFGTGTLTAVRETGGETVFTAKIDTSATDQYTVTFSRTIDDGGGISFLGAAPVKSGNPTYNLIDNVSGTKLDLLFSGGDVEGGAPADHSVNVSTQGAGTDNQSMNEGDLLRIDFMNGGSLAGSPLGSDFNMGTQQTVNGYSFVLTQNTPSGTTGTLFVQAFDADDDKTFVGDAGDTLDPITKLMVNGVTLVDNGALVNGGTTTVNGHTVTAILHNGGVILTGLNEGQSGDGVGADDPVIKLYTKDGFNRIETSNYDGVVVNGQTLEGDDFDIAPAGIDLAVQGTQFNFDMAVQMTDYDGDTGPVEVIGVTIDPVPV